MSINLIADSLNRIRNGVLASLINVKVIRSKVVIGILNCLLKEGYIESYTFVDEFYINVKLKYSSGQSAIEIIKLVSKPSRRVYCPISKLQSFRNGLGIIILSTSKGIITDHEARLYNVGGEVFCKVF